MGFLEDNHFSPAQVAWFAPALARMGGPGKMTSHGAKRAYDMTVKGWPWTLATGGDLRDQGYARANDFPLDSIFLVFAAQKGGNTVRETELTYKCIADDAGQFKKALKKALKGGFNGGHPDEEWVKRNRKTAAKWIGGIGTGAAIIVSFIPVLGGPAGGALILAASGALAATVAAGGDAGDAAEALAESGAADAALSAAGVDPAVVETVAAAAEQLTTDLDAPVEPPDPEDTAEQPEDVPLTLTQQAGRVLSMGRDYAREHPGRVVGSIIGGILLRRIL